MTDHTKTGQL